MSQKPPDPTHIAQLIHSLEDERFAVRKNAQDELEKLSEWVELALRKTLAGRPSLELRQRGEAILKKLEARPFTAQRLQLLRAIETLEGIGTQEARRTLETLAAIRMPHEAKPSLERLGKRSASRP